MAKTSAGHVAPSDASSSVAAGTRQRVPGRHRRPSAGGTGRPTARILTASRASPAFVAALGRSRCRRTRDFVGAFLRSFLTEVGWQGMGGAGGLAGALGAPQSYTVTSTGWPTSSDNTTANSALEVRHLTRTGGHRGRPHGRQRRPRPHADRDRHRRAVAPAVFAGGLPQSGRHADPVDPGIGINPLVIAAGRGRWVPVHRLWCVQPGDHPCWRDDRQGQNGLRGVLISRYRPYVRRGWHLRRRGRVSLTSVG